MDTSMGLPRALLALTLAFSFQASAWAAIPLGTAFTYQGRLNDGGQLASGWYDLKFTLFDVPEYGFPVGDVITNTALAVSGGLFKVELDFGSGVFTNVARWLEIAVKTNGGATYATLLPRQPLTPVPCALYASGASVAAFASAVAAGSVGTAALAPNAVDSSRVADGTLTAADLSPTLASGTFWRLAGNAGTTPGKQFLGTTDDEPLEFKVNGLRAFRLEFAGDSSDPASDADGAPNVIGGAPINYVAPGVVGATIAGGGATNFFGVAYSNSILGFFSTVGGGYGNWIGSNSGLSVIAGGANHSISNNANSSTIGGGFANEIGASSIFGTIAGGTGNKIGTNSGSSAIGGGSANTVTDSARYASIPGGRSNTATNYAFAAGYNAQANHRGAFVWSDGRGTLTASAASNSVTMRASGGYRFFTGTGSGGASLAAGETAWAVMSDRAAKKNFASEESAAVLEKLVRLPITRWNYAWEPDDAPKHLGPVAQDFKAAFYPGGDDRTITTLEFDGVALAAIQGLNRKVEEQLRTKDAKIQSLEERLAALEKALQNHKQDRAAALESLESNRVRAK